MAAKQTLHREKRAASRAVRRNGFAGEMRTARMKTAARSQKRRDRNLVDPNRAAQHVTECRLFHARVSRGRGVRAVVTLRNAY